MSDPGAALADLAGPPRDQAVGDLLEALAEALDSGAEVTPEPELRGPDGTVLREGALSLPRRSDLAVTRDGQRDLCKLDGGTAPPGPKVALAAAGGFIAEIGPFRWDAADLRVYAGTDQPDWAPLPHLRRDLAAWSNGLSDTPVGPEDVDNGMENPERTAHPDATSDAQSTNEFEEEDA